MEDDKRSFKSLDDFNEEIIENKPWAQQLLKTAAEVTRKGVLNWCNVMNKIGDDDMKMEEYVNIFIEHLEALHEDLIFDVDTLHEKMLDKITSLLQEIEKQCIDLHKEMPDVRYEDVSLNVLYNSLKKKHTEYGTIIEIRRKELEDLTKKQTELCKMLGRQPDFLPASPLPSEKKIDELQRYLEELECQKMDREERFLQVREEIAQIMTELKATPQSDFEKEIFSLTNTQVMISDANMEQLDLFHKRVLRQLKSVKDELLELRTKVDNLWNKLEIDIAERDAFCAKHRGNSIETLNAFKLEKERCDNLKIANIKIFIEKHRNELVALWQSCHRSKEEEIEKFGLFNSSCFNEDLLELYEMETEKWIKYYKENSEVLKLLEEYKTLCEQWNELEDKQSAANRYKNRGGQLLAEEKKRNTIRYRQPKVEKKLLVLAEAYLHRNGVPFYTYGVTIPEYLDNLTEQYKRDKKLKLSAKKLEREQQMFGRSNLLSPLPSSSRALYFGTPSRINSTTKRKITTPATEGSKRLKTVNAKKVAATAAPKLNITKVRRLSKKKRQSKHRLSFHTPNSTKTKENVNCEYKKFENEISNNIHCSRSTEIGVKNSEFVVPIPKIYTEFYP